MTLPAEHDMAVKNTYNFLVALIARDEEFLRVFSGSESKIKVPRWLAMSASRCLRHYPPKYLIEDKKPFENLEKHCKNNAKMIK